MPKSRIFWQGCVVLVALAWVSVEGVPEAFAFRQAESNLVKAIRHYRRGNYRIAEIRFRREIKTNETSPWGYLWLARCLAAQGGDLNEMVSVYREALRLNPGLAEVNLELAQVLMRQRKFDEAIVHLEREAELNAKKRLDAYRLIAKCHFYTTRFDKAEEAYRRILALQPRDTAAMNGLARIRYLVHDDYAQAEELLAESSRVDGGRNNRQVWVERANLEAKRKDYVKQAEYLEAFGKIRGLTAQDRRWLKQAMAMNDKQRQTSDSSGGV